MESNNSLSNLNLMDIKMSRFDEVKEVITGMEDDMTKFYEKGNKAAGTRARKGLQNLKKLAQEIRLEIQDIKNNG
jgi:hypothetical protein